MTALPTGIVAGNSGHISHHNIIHALLNPVDAPFDVASIAADVFANIPAAGQAGRQFLDTTFDRLLIDDGADWVPTDTWVFNVRNPLFGAAGDTVLDGAGAYVSGTDDTAALVAANAAAHTAVASGIVGSAIVYYPIGRYLYDDADPIFVTDGRVQHVGQGDASEIFNNGTSHTIDIRGVSGTLLRGAEIVDLYLNSDYSADDHIRMAYCSHVRIRARIAHADGHGINRELVVLNTTLDRVYSEYNGGDGVYDGNIINATVVIGGRYDHNTGYGMSQNAAAGPDATYGAHTNYSMALLAPTIEGNGKEGVYCNSIDARGFAILPGTHIEVNCLNNPVGPNVYIAGVCHSLCIADGVHIVSNSVRNNYPVKLDNTDPDDTSGYIGDSAAWTGHTISNHASIPAGLYNLRSPVTPEIAPTFANSWVNYGAPFAVCQYFRDDNGVVHIRGVIKSGTVNLAAFTLPVGYRPSATRLFTITSNAALGRVDISSSGAVTVTVGNNAFASLEGISFKAEA